MNIYPADAKGPMELSGYIDPDDVTLIEFFWGAPVFQIDTVYTIGSLFKPTVSNGYYYKCIISGKSGSTEPIYDSKSIITGTCKFQSVSYNLFIGPLESISTSTWSATNGVTLSLEDHTTERSNVAVSLVPTTTSSFILTNQVTKGSGESLSRSVKIKINQQ